jgi:hypothetical protein
LGSDFSKYVMYITDIAFFIGQGDGAGWSSFAAGGIALILFSPYGFRAAWALFISCQMEPSRARIERKNLSTGGPIPREAAVGFLSESDSQLSLSSCSAG